MCDVGGCFDFSKSSDCGLCRIRGTDSGFGGGGLRIYAGSVPLDFIREGSVMLAVQTDGGFAPGVRETLMLVARELGRIS